MKQPYLITLGFIMFFLGALSIILSLVGMKFDLLSFLFKIGHGFALLIHLILLFGGVSLIYMGKNKEKMDQERLESQ